MPKAPTSAPPAVTELVEHFQRNLEQYRSLQYKEAEVRREFIDPFFEALGWDVQNKRKYAEAYKDVVHEPSLDEEGAFSRAPDYSFQPAGHIKFFVEAKKPSVNLDENHSPALQLRRYGWTQQLPISILTNFAEFAVYDCRMEPGPADGASTARVLYLTFDEYAEHWDELVGLFSPDAVFKGSFDRFAETRKRKGVAPFDQRFLDDMEAWRKRLAENLALRNHGLSQPELNYAVQQTLDRILFLRICEARGIEPPERLLDVAKHPDIYPNLVQHFRRADDEYNSGLFHFHRQRGRLAPDELTPSLKLDDEVLRLVIGQLYWPARPYAFEVVPADILGQVYERFLGKVIRLTAGHHARVEEKPEVKKAGGVYYTPTYIVDYIVENTVGKLLEDKTPKQASKLRILDPACGSGSFLLGAYDYLLKWYLHAYIAEGPEKHKDRLYPAGGGWKLTIGEKKQILLNNIYGVDIDSQAVEVTKLSLLLKVLEGESEQTAKPRLIKEPALPDLDRNIKCGNSLVGTDFQHKKVADKVADDDEDTRRRVNAFDWKTEFPEITREGGFDAVIGNPPYIRIQAMQQTSPLEVAYFGAHYEAAAKGNYDIYVVFVERGWKLLAKSGVLGYILPSKFFVTDYGREVRQLLARLGVVHKLVDFKHEQVFEGSTTYTCLLFLSGQHSASFEYSVAVPPTAIYTGAVTPQQVHASSLTGDPWMFLGRSGHALFDKLATSVPTLLDLGVAISRGSSTGADDVFILIRDGSHLTTRQGEPVQIEPDLLRTPIYATDFGRYIFRPAANERIIFPYSLTSAGYKLLPEKQFRTQYPKAFAYLSARRVELQKRKQFTRWFGYSAPRNLEDHDSAQILVPLLADRGLYSPASQQMARFCLMASGGFSISFPASVPVSARYVLAVLNSSLLFWALKNMSNVFRGGWITCTKQYVGKLPVRVPDTGSPREKRTHDDIVELADNILTSQDKLRMAKTDHERVTLQRQIDATDRQIDQLVYQLYGLTEDEIALVESSSHPAGGSRDKLEWR